MNIRNVLETVSERHKNTSDISDSIMISCISKLDEKVYQDIVIRHEGAEEFMVDNGDGTFSDRVFPYKNDTQQLIAPHRFLDMYCYYIACEHDIINDEQDRYNNHLILFNEAYQEFVCWYNETHMPLQQGKLRTAPTYQRSVNNAFSY